MFKKVFFVLTFFFANFLVLICKGNSTVGALAINFTVWSSTATISFKKGSRIANELDWTAGSNNLL